MKSLKSILTLICSFIVVAGIVYFFSSQYFDNKVNDYFVVRKQAIKKANSDTVLVIIDDKSISKMRWPWKRSVYADIFDFLQNTAKAKVIMYDAFIVSPDQNPQSDKEFFKRLKTFDKIIGGFDAHLNNAKGETLPQSLMPLFNSKFDVTIKDKRIKIYPVYYKGVTNFLPDYLRSIKALGHVTSFKDADGIVRTFNPFIQINDKIYPAFALTTYAKVTGHKNYVITDKYFCSADDNCASLKIPLQNSIYTNTKWYKSYDNTYTHTKYSAIDIVESYRLVKAGKQPLINPEELRDKIVIVGAAANTHALEDIKQTPILGQQSGSDIVATNLDNLLNNEFTRRSTQKQNMLIIMILSVLVFIAILNFSLVTSASFCACIFLSYFLIYMHLIKHDTIIPIVTTFLLQIIAMLFGYSYRFIIEDTKKRKIQTAMGKYISNDVMKNVVNHIDDVKLGGKRAELSILFADIRGFTSISEQLQPEEVTNILNEYFTEMEPIISTYKGVLNKFIGDAILVIFGDPIYDKDHALNAVRCADHMLKRVKYLQNKWLQEGKPKIEIGVGINTGEAFVGNIGSQNRLEYTVIGDAVNLASRIEGYNKVYKTRFLISHATYQKVRGYVDVIKIKDVTIRGKAKKIDIYEVLRMNEDNIKE